MAFPENFCALYIHMISWWTCNCYALILLQVNNETLDCTDPAWVLVRGILEEERTKYSESTRSPRESSLRSQLAQSIESYRLCA